MNAHVDHVLLEAMTLAPEDRTRIALSLLDSLHGGGESEEAVVASWIAEARARHSDLIAGRTKGLTPDEFRNWFKSL